MYRLLVILGPTATGKTDLAIKLAKKFNGELVSCDSRQVYKGLDIGTGKRPSPEFRIKNYELSIKKQKKFWEINGIKIWMYDVVDINKQYTVYDYVKDAGSVIDDIVKRGKMPIVVGGTGLYLKALLYGLPNLAIPIDKNLRKKLQKLTKEQLQNKLQQISPDKWESLNKSDRQNPRRLVRAIELVILSETEDLQDNSSKLRDSPLTAQNDVLKLGLTAPREILYKRADERVISRINLGMIEETKSLHKTGLGFKRMRQLGLEYGVLADFMEGKIKEKEELQLAMQGKIHDFIRRQLTWFKREKNMEWFDISDNNFLSKVEDLVSKWYDNFHVKQNRYIT